MSTTPNYASTPRMGQATLTAANNVYDGTGTVGTVLAAGAAGTFVGAIKAKPLGTNVASVARFFVNNGSSNGTPANNYFIGELALPATTASAAAALTELSLPVGFAIPAGHSITALLGTAVAAGWQFVAIAGDL